MTLVALLDFVVAAIALAPAAAVAVTLGGRAGPGSALVAGAGLGALVAGFAVLAGMGLLQLEEYGRRSQFGLALLGLPLIPVGTAVSILLWTYLSRPGTRLLFAGRSQLSAAEQASVSRAAEEQGLALAGAALGLVAGVLVLLALVVVLVARLVASLPHSGGVPA